MVKAPEQIVSVSREVVAVGRMSALAILLAAAILTPCNAADLGPLDHMATTAATNRSQCGSACRCDSLCAQFGDCCPESEYFVAEEQRMGASNFVCTSISGRDFYLKSKCPPEWEDMETRNNCERSTTVYSDPLLDVPLTSRRTSITYHNWHCAFCNNDIEEGTSRIWPSKFYCETKWNRSLRNEEVFELLHYETERETWVLDIQNNTNESNKTNNTCFIMVEVPRLPELNDRGCVSNAINTCPENWTNESVQKGCEAHLSYVCSDSISYRNEYCAICNDVPSFGSGACITMRIKPSAPEYLPPFSMLLNWHNLENQNKCKRRTEIYDPLYRSCRQIFMKQVSARNDIYPNVTKNNDTLSTRTPITTVETCDMPDFNETVYNQNFVSCSKFCLGPDSFITDDYLTSVYVPGYKRNYSEGEFTITSDNKLIICIPREFLWTGNDDTWGIVTAVGITISVVFLILHLVVFIITPKLHNLSSLNLASLCVTLLFLYTSFIAVSWTEIQTSSCVAVAVIMHYGLLASFFWMLTIAFDIFRVLRQATSKLIVISGTQWKRYGIYSLWTWLVPAVVIILAMIVDFCPNIFPEDLKPGYGTGPFCWLGNPHGLLLFCITPLALIMILNVIFFSWSAYLISSAAADTRNSSTTHRDFTLYLRLALLMGLTWIIGLIAGATQVNGLWALFVVLNTLQGFFIFVAFSCSQKVWREVYRHSVKIRSRGQQMHLAVHTPATASTNTNTHTKEYGYADVNLTAPVLEKG